MAIRDSVEVELLARGLSPRTVQDYAGIIRRAEAWCQRHGADLATIDWRDFQGHLDGLPWSWSSRKAARSALVHWCEIIGRPPPTVLVPRQPRMYCRALEPDEAHRLARAAFVEAGRPRGLTVLLALHLALRASELASLRWDAFGAYHSELHLMGKGGVAATLPVHPSLSAILGSHPHRSEWVFPMRSDPHRPVSRQLVTSRVRFLARSVGVEGVTTHRLRHTALTTANDRLGDLRAVQSFARHSSPTLTSGYTRTSRERLRRVAEAIDYSGDAA